MKSLGDVDNVIVSGCFCPQLEMRKALPAGAIWIPTPGGNLGPLDEISYRLGIIEGLREQDLIIVTTHAPCPSEPVEEATYMSTGSYVEEILRSGMNAVGIFLGSKAVTVFNPAGISHPSIGAVYDGACDLSTSFRKEKPIDLKSAIKRVKLAPFFSSDRIAREGTIYLSTLFPLQTRAINLLRSWGDPHRHYSRIFKPNQVRALEAQFS